MWQFYSLADDLLERRQVFLEISYFRKCKCGKWHETESNFSHMSQIKCFNSVKPYEADNSY